MVDTVARAALTTEDETRRQKQSLPMASVFNKPLVERVWRVVNDCDERARDGLGAASMITSGAEDPRQKFREIRTNRCFVEIRNYSDLGGVPEP